MYLILYWLVFVWPAWVFPLIAACISIRRGLIAYTQRRKGVYSPLPTYKQELHRWNVKWHSFCDSPLGVIVFIAFYGIMIMGPVLYADDHYPH